MKQQKKRAYLVLEDGTVLRGWVMGKQGETIGEVVFNTCMTSYQTALSDPACYGQLVAQTFPLAGNRGFSFAAGQGNTIAANGYIVRECSDAPSRFDDGATLDEYLRAREIVGISGIDTRRLTRIVRDKGYFKGAITPTLEGFDALLERIAAYSVSGAVQALSITKAQGYDAQGEELFHVLVPDFGFRRDLLAALTKRGCRVTVVPAHTAVQELLAYEADGFVYPDGPADPDDDPTILQNLQQLLATKPVMLGIGVGHQMLAIACGGIVGEMPRGHRGANQPVQVLGTQRVMVTTQNHAYDVAPDSLREDVAQVTMRNINDASVEGLRYFAFPGMSVQFVPQDNETYSDTAWIYDTFITMLQAAKTKPNAHNSK